MAEHSPKANRWVLGRIPFLSRYGIGLRLTLCFLLIIVLMLVGNAFLIWQFRLVRQQASHLAATDQELIAVLRFQTSLHTFYNRLDDLVQSRNKAELVAESAKLRETVNE